MDLTLVFDFYSNNINFELLILEFSTVLPKIKRRR